MTRLVSVFAALTAAAACGSGAEHGVDGAIDGTTAVDAGPTRGYRLAATGVQADPTTGIFIGATELANDADVIAIHQDFYGVPWDSFIAGTEPPAAWVAKMQMLAASAQGKPVFLSLTPLDGDRVHLAPKVAADGTLVSDWSAACYDLATATDGATLRTAYAAYVTWMIQMFQPQWTNIAIELNLFYASCPTSWPGMVTLENDAYVAAKAAAPTVPAFPSIQINALNGDSQCPMGMSAADCYEAEYAAIADLERDRFAISAYPYAASYATAADLPADWLTRGATRGGERLFIAETGWLATDVAATDPSAQCATILSETPQIQSDYFDLLITTAQQQDIEVVTWFSDRDAMPAPVATGCPCSFSTPWCDLIAYERSLGSTPTDQFYNELLFKIFGTLGIRDYDGNPRQPIYDHWQAARVDPIAP